MREHKEGVEQISEEMRWGRKLLEETGRESTYKREEEIQRGKEEERIRRGYDEAGGIEKKRV